MIFTYKYLEACPLCEDVRPVLRETGDKKEYYVYTCPKCDTTLADYDEARMFEYTARKLWNKNARHLKHFILKNNVTILKR